MRTYLDTGVFRAAWEASEDEALVAFAIFDDPVRELVGSPLLRLELIPKPTFNSVSAEVALYEHLFSGVQWTPIGEDTVARAIELSSVHDVIGIDALHVASAELAGVDQFITTERDTKPMFRVKSVNPVNLFAL